MARLTIGFGIALVILGLAGYVLSQAASVTALIPAFFGLALTLTGMLALNERFRKHAMHAAVALGLLGFLGSVRGLASLPAVLTGNEVARPLAVVAQSIMAVLMGTFTVLCIRSFLDARRRRASATRS